MGRIDSVAIVLLSVVFAGAGSAVAQDDRLYAGVGPSP
jgi:hypothetical protein